LKSADYELVYRDILAVTRIVTTAQKLTKVIIETSKLTTEEKIAACVIAQMAGADFVKTSTGFGGGGATVEDITLMRWAVGTKMGVKASGGVRSLEEAQAMIQAGATRIGTSSGVQIVQGQSSTAAY
jgi:deoxyribose-phosphate aldolase